jgi:hypothetical protein
MSTQSAPAGYQLPQQAGAASGLYGGAQSLTQGGQSLQNISLPGYSNLYSGATNNPYYGSAMNTAGSVAQTGGQIGAGEIGAGQSLQALSGQISGAIPGTLATGYDPQGALYNQQYALTTEQQSAINAANGVAGSPFGAGLTGQAGQNFNLGWQNNEQSRQLAALSGAGSAAQTASGLDTAGANLQGLGLQTEQTSGMLPYQTYNANQQNIAQMLNSLVSGTNQSYGLTQEGTQDYGSYLGYGQSATGLAQNATQINNQTIMSAMSGIGNLFGGILGDLNIGSDGISFGGG